MPSWGQNWGLEWGPLRHRIFGDEEGAERVKIGDSFAIQNIGLVTIRVGSTRFFTTIQAALNELRDSMVALGFLAFDVQRTILLDPEVFNENVVIPANLPPPTGAAPLVIACDPGITPQDVVVDGGNVGPCFLVQKPHVHIECITIRNGNPAAVRIITPSVGTRITRDLIINNAEDGVRSEAGVDAPLIANCVFHGNPKAAIRLTSNTGTPRIVYNSILVPAGTIPVPSLGVVATESNLQMRNSILVAQGSGAVSRVLDFIHAGAKTITSNFNNLFRFVAGPLVRLDSGAGPTDFNTLAVWKAAPPAQDANSISEDPDFVDVDAGEVRLRLRVNTPSHRAGTFIPDILVDLFGSTRPQDQPSQGAIEPMNVILDQGKRRILEILSGLVLKPVDRALGGVAGTLAALPEIFDPEATARLLDKLDDEVFDLPIPPSRIRRVGRKVIFDVRFGPSAKLMRERLDQVVDPLSEIGLAFSDRLLFTRLTLREMPLEPLMHVTTHVDIGIEFI